MIASIDNVKNPSGISSSFCMHGPGGEVQNHPVWPSEVCLRGRPTITIDTSDAQHSSNRTDHEVPKTDHSDSMIIRVCDVQQAASFIEDYSARQPQTRQRARPLVT
jgi:hypothetical protein